MVNLTIGGGSYKGLAFLGALEYLYKKNYLGVIDNFYGCSVGSIIGVLFIIGYKPRELLNIIINLDLDEFWDLSIENIETKFSILSHKFFDKLEEFFINKKVNTKITIEQFNKKYDININIFSININNNLVTNFNETNFKDLEILVAIKASCSIPFIFPPVIINSEYYVDGCFKCLNGDFHENQIDKTNIGLGYIIRLNFDYNPIKDKLNLNEYLNTLLRCLIYNKNRKIVYTKNTLELNLKKKFSNKVSFNNISYSDKIELFYEGLQQAINFYD